MKILKQFGIIFFICWIGVIIEHILPFSFPSSVISLVLLLICLLFGLVKVEHIQEKSDFLLSNMAFFFIPAGVSVINYFDIVRANWLPIAVICIITTVLTFAAVVYSIKLTNYLLNRRERQED